MHFEIIGEIDNIQTFATGHGIRELARLNRFYGEGRWRKRKGYCTVKLEDSLEYSAEVHWYEAAGIGRKEFKIKQIIDT